MDNPPRVLPDDLQMHLKKENWDKYDDFYNDLKKTIKKMVDESSDLLVIG